MTVTGQVDRQMGLVGNVANKAPCDCASAGANLVLNGEQIVDGVQTAASRVLVKDQTDPTTNGIYDTDTGAWTLALDCDG
ncbi:MAG TPA: hypothetical protein VMU55_01630, partial [Solirubrobacteraceae bacterium]|nr:hypothetical protein [Solirubrobacteraceae bacterium]